MTYEEKQLEIPIILVVSVVYVLLKQMIKKE